MTRLRAWSGVLSNRNFALLWAGQSISMVGSRVTTVALPSLAVLTLHAGALVVGGLVALQWAPFLVLGPLAGVWADRIERRKLMIATDLLRLAALGSVPIASSFGVLSLAQVLAAAAVVGFANVFFNVAYHAYLPTLLPQSRLTEGNARLELSSSVANVLGPLLAGGLIAAVGAATTLAVDALSFGVSAVSVLAIRAPEEHRGEVEPLANVLDDLREGAAAVLRNPYLVTLAGTTTTGNLAVAIGSSVLFPYLYRNLDLSPGDVGIALAVGGATLVASALGASWLAKRVGIGNVMLIGPVVAGVGYLILPLSSRVAAPLAVVVVSQVLLSATRGPSNVAILGIVQSATPNRLLGRVNGVTLPFVFGSFAIGGVVGGVVGRTAGSEATLLLAGVVTVLQVAWVLAGPIHAIGRELPTVPEEADEVDDGHVEAEHAA